MANTTQSKFEFFQDETKSENVGRAVFYSALGEAILVIEETPFEHAHNIMSAINKAERAKGIQVKLNLSDKLNSEAYD
jgi:hypothetical protein